MHVFEIVCSGGYLFENVLHGGGFAVTFFFVLSGFCITLGYGTKFDCFTKEDAIRFLRRRLRKIYPVYIFTMVWAAIYEFLKLGVNNMLSADKIVKIAAKLLLSGTMLQSLTVVEWGILNSAAWFISTIFCCYACTPFILKALRKVRGNVKILKTISAACCLTVIFAYYCESFLEGQLSEYGELFLYVSPCFRIIFYIYGICIAFMVGEKSGAKQATYKKASFSQAMAVIASMAGYLAYVRYTIILGNNCLDCVVMALAGIWLYVFSAKGFFSDLLGANSMRIFGNISMYVYLLHYVIINFGGDAIFRHFVKGSGSYVFLEMAVLFLATVIISIAAYAIQNRCFKPMTRAAMKER